MSGPGISTLLRVTVPLLALLLGGCGGGKRASAENDLLRARILELEDRLAEQESRRRELETQLEQARRNDPVPPDVRENTPAVADISVGRLTHARDGDGDGVADELVVYVHPADGRGRFVQLTGSLSVHVATLPSDRDAVTLGRVTLGPAEVRDAYRSGLTGTHYTVRVPLEAGTDAGECTVRVEFEDGHSGRRFETQRSVEPGPRSAIRSTS